MPGDFIQVLPPNCTIREVAATESLNASVTDSAFTYRGSDDDTNALIYILVVISIYVFSLAFFFVKYVFATSISYFEICYFEFQIS